MVKVEEERGMLKKVGSKVIGSRDSAIERRWPYTGKWLRTRHDASSAMDTRRGSKGLFMQDEVRGSEN